MEAPKWANSKQNFHCTGIKHFSLVNSNFDDDDEHVVHTFVLKLIILDLKYFVSQTIMKTEESVEHLMNW